MSTNLIPGYCKVAQMGHKIHVGFTEEIEVCGVKMLRIILPAVEGDDYWHRLPSGETIVHPQSLYGIDEASLEEAMSSRKCHRVPILHHQIDVSAKVDFSKAVEEVVDAVAEVVAKSHDNWNYDGPCRSCGGTGKYNGQDCILCEGSGKYEVPF